jgi:hypothetical protein
MQYRRRPGPTTITPYADTLRRALETDAHRPRRERRTARKGAGLLPALRSEVGDVRAHDKPVAA